MSIIKYCEIDMNHSLSPVEGVQTIETNRVDENHNKYVGVHNRVQYNVVWYPCTNT